MFDSSKCGSLAEPALSLASRCSKLVDCFKIPLFGTFYISVNHLEGWDEDIKGKGKVIPSAGSPPWRRPFGLLLLLPTKARDSGTR